MLIKLTKSTTFKDADESYIYAEFEIKDIFEFKSFANHGNRMITECIKNILIIKDFHVEIISEGHLKLKTTSHNKNGSLSLLRFLKSLFKKLDGVFDLELECIKVEQEFLE